MNINTDNYINAFLRAIQPEYPGVLGEIQKEALKNMVPAIPHETARFLSVLLTILKPKNILEVGTGTAFSSSLMSGYLSEGGKITTIDRFDVMLKDAYINLERMGLKDTVKIIKGDAADVLPGLTEKYDVIFLDAAKAQYIQFLPYVIKLLLPGGVLLADDVLQGGFIAKSRFNVPRRQRTIHKRMRNFLWEATHNPELSASIIPIGDGLLFAVKLKELSDNANK